MGFINIGPLEIALILIIALLVLGPARLPDAARSVGKGMREFKQSLSGDHEEEERVPRDDRALHDEQ
jgi:sec-independent protein translocase protein TatA